jgi:hypothetical protein
MFLSWKSVVIFFKPIIGFAAMFVLFTWFFETRLFKEIFNLSVNKHGKLIRILENYYLQNDFAKE